MLKLAIPIGAKLLARHLAVQQVPELIAVHLAGQAQHLTDWLAHAGIEQGPLFRSINRHGNIAQNRLSGDAVAVIVKRRVEAAAFDPVTFSGHSLRAGLATSAAMAGASSWKIR